MKNANRIPKIELSGSPRQRGQKHGEELKPLIYEGLENWKYFLYTVKQKDPDKIIDQFVENTNFLSAIKKWTPHLLEEVEGIADGCGTRFNDIYAFQLTIPSPKK
ncbi:MAG: hypothetical protein MUO76_20780 [Anaerolineaceae bacterium]|nr:hypothetical protein [Anaerolineaceae bacterium]